MSRPKNPRNARLEALAAITAVLDEQQSLSEYFQAESVLPDRDRAFARHLAYGVLRWLIALEWLATRLINRPLKRKDRDIHRLVMIGLFQLWKDDTADHAAVHATAECAGLVSKKWATGLVNALLRRFQREQADWLNKLEGRPETYAHPKWLLEQIKQDWPDNWQSIARENNRHAGLWLRVNRQLSSPEEMVNSAREQDFEAVTHTRAEDAIMLTPAVPVSRIPGFAEGRVSVQDPAAQLAASFIQPLEGERILDACAAPGGKSCHLLEKQPGISLLVLDRDAGRLDLIRENLQRLGLSGHLQAADAGNPEEWWDKEPFDKILLDAPCSTTGVIRRHPDIKCLRDPGQVDRAVEDQKRLLDGLWPLLKSGGILVYATCSILKRENHKQIHGFLSQHQDAELAGPNVDTGHPELPGEQILPGEEGMDGFYYAVIRKSV